jgi:hypothetical protein
MRKFNESSGKYESLESIDGKEALLFNIESALGSPWRGGFIQ